MIANKTSQKKPISDSKAEKLEAKNLNKKHLGKFLIETAPRGEELSLPSRVLNQPDPFVEWDQTIASLAGELRANCVSMGRACEPMDAMIVATALKNGLTLVT